MNFSMFKQLWRKMSGLSGWGLIALFLAAMPPLALAQSADSAKGQNQILAVSAEQEDGLPIFNIQTREPVGYRYTVYDSFDPVRVVVDFPGMDVSGVDSVIKVDSQTVKEVRVSSLELATGQLGRVEFLLTEPTNYNVFLANNNFRVTFNEGAKKPAPVPAAAPVKAAPLVAPETPAEVPGKKALLVKNVDIEAGRATLFTDGFIETFKQFNLSAPPRLVVDVYGVRPDFKERSFPAGQGFKQMRIGTYEDRTRFVFDAEGDRLPKNAVAQQENMILVTWTESGPSGQRIAPGGPLPPSGQAVRVDTVDFRVDNGQSIFTVSVSGSPEITEPVKKGDIVRFGIKNASISRALRRAVDPSAFPSAVRLITPYTVREGKAQEVRFAVELKGQAPYSLKVQNGKVVFTVANGPFAEPAPEPISTVGVPVVAPAAQPVAVPGVTAVRGSSLAPAAPVAAEIPARAVDVSQKIEPQYTGQKISLVFDDADIRKILQLIAEVSNLNIIVADEVKGSITLRLIDVPWDQALDLIMDIKDLGMLREGNVVRVLPKSKIREMDEAKFTAARTKEKLEDLITEVISVSYSDLGNVAAPSRELLTERGKITEDSRNKQIIVTDVPSAVDEVKRLIKILDTPERQVMIEARIVEANSSFRRDLGVKWGLSFNSDSGGPWDISNFSTGLGGSFLIPPPSAGNVGAAGLGTGITFGQVGIDSTVLDLRISALESAGEGKVISTPRVSTLNGGEATISQGTKIPYVSSDGDDVKTEFVDANLELNVKPVINPDNSIILDIEATNSSVGSNVSVGVGNAPSIDTKEAKTKVLVRDGETTVIGGIFVESENTSDVGVPLLMDIPILGHLFKSSNVTSTRGELLIFITPRIVQ